MAGPIWCCWCGYFFSSHGRLQEGRAVQHRTADQFITPWLLQRLNAYFLANGTQLLDYFDIHYYFSTTTDQSSQSAQLNVTSEVRSLYDAGFNDTGYILKNIEGPAVNLIPRFQAWIRQYAPNLTLPLAISEISFVPSAARGNTNGAIGDGLAYFSAHLAQAEALAVLGKYGVAYAARWVSPTPGSAAAMAYDLYLNFDGQHSGVQGVSVNASSSAWPNVTSYAVYNGSSASLYVLLFSLQFVPVASIAVTITDAALQSGASSAAAAVWLMSAAASTLQQQPQLTVTQSTPSTLMLSLTNVANRSATLLVVQGVVVVSAAVSSSSSAAAHPFSSSSSSTSSSAAAQLATSSSAVKKHKAVSSSSAGKKRTAPLSSSSAKKKKGS